MYARIVTAMLRPEAVDEAHQAYMKLMAPGQRPAGLKRLIVLGDRATGNSQLITLWESEEAMKADTAAFQQRAADLGQYMIRPPSAEMFEVFADE